jgi:serine/threonine protein kinase
MEDDFELEDGLPNVDEAHTIHFEQLKFDEEIGSGSFGSVYKGTYLGTPVAIKKIAKSEDLQRGARYLRPARGCHGQVHPPLRSRFAPPPPPNAFALAYDRDSSVDSLGHWPAILFGLIYLRHKRGLAFEKIGRFYPIDSRSVTSSSFLLPHLSSFLLPPPGIRTRTWSSSSA